MSVRGPSDFMASFGQALGLVAVGALLLVVVVVIVAALLLS